MRLPAQLSHRKRDSHKNDFGHVLILAGSSRMVGAASLCSLAAMRSGAGLVTVGIPESLNSILQKKISPVIMSLPLAETSQGTLDPRGFQDINHFPCDVIVLGPGLSTHPATTRLVLKIIREIDKPLVIDADALNIVSTKVDVLNVTPSLKILTPHPGEMACLTKLSTKYIQAHRLDVVRDFARKINGIVILKGYRSIVAEPLGKFYVNRTGNPGMATAGTGDVLSGMLAGLLSQGLRQGISGFVITQWACYLHGKAGDLAAHKKTMMALIATDLIDEIPFALKASSRKSPLAIT